MNLEYSVTRAFSACKSSITSSEKVFCDISNALKTLGFISFSASARRGDESIARSYSFWILAKSGAAES